MSDELNTQEGQAPEITPTQEQAMTSGWVPKDQYKGDPEKWVDAAEFVRRGELFSKIDHQGRELKELRKTLEVMATHHKNVSEIEYQRALQTLKAQKKNALEEGDADAVIAVDEQIDQVKEFRRQAANTIDIPQPAQEHPTFVNWKEQNKWYEASGPMRAYADALGNQLHASGMTPDQVLQKVAEEVRKEFPNKFTNPRQARPSAVEGSVPRSGGAPAFELSQEESRVMNRLIRDKVLTREQYIADLKKIKGVQ